MIVPNLQPRLLEREDSQLDSHFDLSKWGAILREPVSGGSAPLPDSASPPLALDQTAGPRTYAEVNQGNSGSVKQARNCFAVFSILRDKDVTWTITKMALLANGSR